MGFKTFCSRFFVRFKTGLGHPLFIGFSALLASFIALFNFSQRLLYVFIDEALFHGFAEGLVGVLAAVAVYDLVLYYLITHRITRFRLGLKIAFGVSWFLLIAGIFFVLVFNDQAPENIYLYWKYFFQSLPVVLALFLVFFLIFEFPTWEKRWRTPVGIGLAFVISMTTVMAVFDLFPLSFTSEPVVLATGNSYHVVWASDDEGIGAITYTYGGTEYEVIDATDGYARLSRLHSVEVPQSHLDGNDYTLSVTRVRDVLPYGTKAGATISQTYAFDTVPTDDLTFTVASDYHNQRTRLYEAESHLSEANAFIVLGDEMDCLNNLDDVIGYIVTPLGKLTHGKIPTVLVRGNHEARGAFSGNLASSLGLDKLYDQVSFGDYRFTILDTGEDKVDEHIEYGPMTDYSLYMKEELESWLERVPSMSGTYDITLAHDPTICYGKKTTADDAIASGYFNEMDRLGTDLMISGHWHDARMYLYDDESYAGTTAPSFPAFLAGGIEDDGYQISQLLLSAGQATVRSFHQDGSSVLLDEGHGVSSASIEIPLLAE